MRAPRIVTNFIIVFFVVHVGSFFLTNDQYAYLIENLALTPSQLSSFPGIGFDIETVRHAMQFVTYAFLHSSFSHLLINSMIFLIFATPVARRIGTARLLALMLITAIAAALTHLFFYWGSSLPVVGASGVDFGLIGAAFRFIFIDPNARMVWPPALLSLASRPVLLGAALIVALNVVMGLSGFTPDGFGVAVAWEAHLGGFFTGLLIFPLFDRQRSWIS
ncbi:MAG: rhomboid family intramembrane serine protease [Alphaproteobacteria bacterium]|nr:rhomboid family intramembrane serine protease [Alphaproteobacteria bacterium]